MSDSTNEREQTTLGMGADGKNRMEKRIPRPPFYANEYIDMAEALELIMDSFGQLILALMTYIVDGTIPDDLPQEIKPIFHIYKKKVDLSNKKYDMVCEKNAKNGAKGGRPRKRAASEDEPALTPTHAVKKSKPTPKIKMPPAEEQLIQLIEAGQDEGTISGKCDPREFFEWAEALEWKVNKEPAKNVGDFLTYATAKYPTEKVIGPIGTLPKAPQLSHAYGIIFKELHGLRDEEGNTGALVAAIDFLKAYDSGWNFHGQKFSDAQWREALNEFIEDLKTE